MAPRLRLDWPILIAAIVAACGGATASPAASEAPPVMPAATEAPPNVPPAPSAAAQRESPRADAGGPYADALVAALGAENLVTHVEQTATVTTSVDPDTEITARLTGDIAGEDVAMVIELSTPGVDQVQELVVVGDTAYTRQGDGDWLSAPRAAVADSLVGLVDNLRVVGDPNHLRYVGLEEFEGRQLHHLTGATDIPYAPSTGGTGRFTALDVWMEEDGTPVSIRGDFAAVDGAGNQGEGTTEMRFSTFGGPIEIEAPDTDT